ncbi:MAG: hypothetical protein IT379_03585 [Deltaproteobacteria bacterium]|nr:hypothetical protein [Deltaproteobacteria bacterium]
MRALALAAVVACMGCEDAALVGIDARVDDQGIQVDATTPDLGTSDGGETDGGALDSGSDASDAEPPPEAGPDAPPSDASLRPPIESPSVPAPPEAATVDWLTSTDYETAVAASPVIGAVDPPSMGPCAPWPEVTETDGLVICEPFPGGRDSCLGAESAHFPGESACSTVGTACPASGRWADVTAGGATVVFVRRGAAGGNGTEASPYGTIAAALASLGTASPAVVALDGATFAESIELPPGVTLWGACPAQTIIAPPAGMRAVHLLSGSGGLRNLTVSQGTTDEAVVAESGSSLTLDAVVVRGGGHQIVAHGGSVLGTNVIARDAVRASDAAQGTAIVAREGGTVALTRAALTSAARHAVALGRGSVTLTDVSILRTGAEGIYVGDFSVVDSVLTARRVVIEETGLGALFSNSGGLTFDLDRVVVRDCNGGFFILSGAGPSVVLSRILIEDTPGGIGLAMPTRLTDVVMRDVDGACLGAWNTFDYELTRLRFERCSQFGIRTWELSRMIANDVDVRDVGSASVRGAAIEVTQGPDATGGSLRLRDAHVSGTHGVGVDIHTPLADATLTDVVVEGTRSGPMNEGYGIRASDGAELTLDGVSVIDSERAGVAAGNASVEAPLPGRPLGAVSLTNVAIHARASATTGARACIVAADGAHVSGEGVVCTEASGTAISVMGDGSQLELDDLVVTDVGRPGDGEPGVAVRVESGAAATLRRTAWARVSDLGLLARDDAVVTIEDATLSRPGAEPGDEGGRGIWVREGSVVTVERLATETWPRAALDAEGGGVELIATDVEVLAGNPMATGAAFFAHAGATLNLTAGAVRSWREAALRASGPGTDVVIDGLIAEGTGVGPALFGYGVFATDAARITGGRVRVAGARGLAVGTFGAEATLVLGDVDVDGVEQPLPGDPAATGIGAYGGGDVRVTRFLVEGAQTAGAHLVAGSVLELSSGRIGTTPVGIAVPEGSPLESVLFDVEFRDCGTDVLVGSVPQPRRPD